jgi:hypothetical protein
MAFLNAAGTCLIPVQHDPPINPMLDDQTTMGNERCQSIEILVNTLHLIGSAAEKRTND